MKISNKKNKWIICGMILVIILTGCGYRQRTGTYKAAYNVFVRELPKKTADLCRETVADFEKTIVVYENDSVSDSIETSIRKEDSLMKTSYEIDRQLEAELNSGNYTWDEPMVIMNPYKISPLTGVVLFATEEDCAVRVTVKGKTAAADITGELPSAKAHRVPLIGLYPSTENTVVLELLDADGNVSKSQELKVQTSGLPELMDDMVRPVKVSGTSAYGLTMVYGQNCLNSFAYDCEGDVRWFLDRKSGNSGLYNLSNGRFIFQDKAAYTPSPLSPYITNLLEMDYLGRVHNLYYIPGGNHHEVKEKEPGGNLLATTSSLKGHVEDKIVELDRKTGKIVNELEIEDIFGEAYANKVDWAHLNTVSYQKETDTILISPRNLQSGVKINWTTHEIVWILGIPEFWKGSEFEKYVLKPQGDIVWHFQQHTVYQVDADLDNNPDTVEISVFDNHWHHDHKVKQYDGRPDSYATVYSVDEKNMTVKQIKNLPIKKSRITSNVVYDKDSNHLFAMAGALVNTEDKRIGMTYEFDYDTGEIINQYSIKGKFYRATEMSLNFEDLSSAMVPDENYMKGSLRPAVKVAENIETPEKTLKKGMEFKLVGSVLYVYAQEGKISRMIFKGKEHSYVYDLADITRKKESSGELKYHLPIPLQNLESDEYEIYCVYEDEFYNTGMSFKK